MAIMHFDIILTKNPALGPKQHALHPVRVQKEVEKGWGAEIARKVVEEGRSTQTL